MGVPGGAQGVTGGVPGQGLGDLEVSEESLGFLGLPRGALGLPMGVSRGGPISRLDGNT